MKKYFLKVEAFTLVTILMCLYACQQPVKKETPKQAKRPMLVKTFGDPRYGNVNCGIEDRAGNLWFGTTENGLYKYDGKTFHRFLSADGLVSNDVTCLLEDKEGKIWIGSSAGLSLLDGKGFNTVKIPLPKQIAPNKNEYYRDSHSVFSIMQAKDGRIWFATIDAVFIFDGKYFTPFVISEKSGGFMSSNNNAERILQDSAGNIWFGGRGNEDIYRYDGKSIANYHLEDLFQNGPTPKPHHWAWPQLQDKNGDIWFSNWGGVYRFNGKSFQKFDLPNAVTSIVEDKNGHILLGGENGISRFDGQTFIPLPSTNGIFTPWVWSILPDKKGQLWIGTRETGLFLYDGKTFINSSEYKH